MNKDRNRGNRQSSGKKKNSAKRHSRRYIVQRRKRNLMVAGITIVAAILLCIVAFIGLFAYVAIQNDDMIADGIYIADQDVSGLTMEEATVKIDGVMKQYGAAIVAVEVADSEEEFPSTTLDDLGFDMVNEEKLIQQAWDYGKSEGIWANFQKLQDLKEEPVMYYPDYTVEEEKVQTYLTENYASVEVEPKNASITIEGGQIAHHDGENGTTLDIDRMMTEIGTRMNEKWTGEDLLLQLQVTPKEPAIQLSDLEVVQDLLGNFSTSLSDDGNRYDNVGRAAECLNGTLIMPGEEISVAGVTGPYTEKNGYANAPSYANGQVVNSLGGGICQVSTTMYNAVLEAELEVTQRQAHSMTVSYVKPGKDAAIAGDYKDLKFVNSTEYPVYLVVNLYGGTLDVAIYGKDTRPENRTVEFVAKEVSSEEMNKVYTADSSRSLGAIATTSSGKRKITAEYWKYISIDGVETEQVKLNTSYYNGTETKVSVGTKSSDSEASSIVASAVATQDIDKINAAIARAKEIIANKAAAEQQAQEDAQQQAEAEDSSTEEGTQTE